MAPSAWQIGQYRISPREAEFSNRGNMYRIMLTTGGTFYSIRYQLGQVFLDCLNVKAVCSRVHDAL